MCSMYINCQNADWSTIQSSNSILIKRYRSLEIFDMKYISDCGRLKNEGHSSL